MSIVDIMSNFGWISFVIFALLFSSAQAAGSTMKLLMVEDEICPWCERWEKEIGGAYGKTEEGQIAPLMRMDIDDPIPKDVTLKGKARFTPTFILLIDGAEVQRIEGYPGEDFFYPALNQMLQSAQ
ncbi:hypothetical protein PsAD13_01517 [Pseudovibrio sp. Ad13]|uniref:thioredoxin family protein n=1 Tax=Pseudovibrio sp. Ad13 TaxID=989396 RepID=UPI0007B2612D|nr:thioredoxin family protein [Pseudovibrio sp. Ad13]KZK84983.1 hypothetical protein PsAD13_01517 [Pseudovibrio sp. Ad13]